jgi:hypothetical protein
MTFAPSLGTMPGIDQDIQAGLGDLAAEIGQTYDVYRLSNATNVGVLSGSPIYANFPVNVRRYPVKAAIEGTLFEILLYVANCDRRPLDEMDILVTQGYLSDGGVFCVVQMRPMAETLLVGCPFNATITSVNTDAGAASQQPSSGNIPILASSAWSGTYKENETVLTLNDGEYAFSTPGSSVTPAQIQVGIQPTARIRDGNDLGVPTEQPRAPFVAFIPRTPGVFLEETKTIINVGNASSDRYQIKKYFTTDQTALAGQYAMVEKLPF